MYIICNLQNLLLSFQIKTIKQKYIYESNFTSNQQILYNPLSLQNL